MYVLQNATAFNNACKAADRLIATKCEIYNNGSLSATMVGSGQNGEIISMEWDNIVCSNDGFQIGTCCMDEFKMTYRPVSTTMSLMNKQIKPYVGVDISGTVTYVPLGVFYVTNAETSDDGYTIDITAYDGMQKLLNTFDATAIGVTFPIKAWLLLEAIATYHGFTISFDKEVYPLIDSASKYIIDSNSNNLVVQEERNVNLYEWLNIPLDGTYRDYIGWIAGLIGGYAHMGRNGELVIARYENHSFSIGRDVQHMGGATINYGGSVEYESIISGTENAPIYPTGYSGNAIMYSNPYITQEELDRLCGNMFSGGNIVVTPCEVEWRSNPCVDAGDIVSVVDKNDNGTTVYVMERVMRVTGGLSETLYCYGKTEMQQSLDASPTTSMIANIPPYIKVLDADGTPRELMIKTVTIDGVTINYLGY